MATSPSGTADGTLSNVASSASSVTILAANARAMKRIVYNESSSSLKLRFASGAASATSYTVNIPTNTLFEFPQPLYRGAVTGIWDSANGSARVTEY